MPLVRLGIMTERNHDTISSVYRCSAAHKQQTRDLLDRFGRGSWRCRRSDRRERAELVRPLGTVPVALLPRSHAVFVPTGGGAPGV